MKVKELIVKLQGFDPELPVCLADWNEAYREPSEPEAEQIGLVDTGWFWSSSEELVNRQFICIGSP